MSSACASGHVDRQPGRVLYVTLGVTALWLLSAVAVVEGPFSSGVCMKP